MSEQGGDSRLELEFRLQAQAARIEALQAALREIANHPDYECRTDGKSYALPWAFWNVKRIAKTSLAPEQDK
jgi:hypothetical protein